MYESSQMLPTPRVYSLKELHYLCEKEGKFDDAYYLVTEKTLNKHIRFPALSKTVIEVYPDPKGQRAIIFNLTKESRGKDFALSILTDGWSDALSSAQSDNAYKISVLMEEFRRLVALSADSPMELEGGAIMETEVSSGFSTLELVAYDDRIEFVNTKKGKKKVMPYNQMKEVEAKNKVITVRMMDGSSEVGVFSSYETYDAWDKLIQRKRQEASSPPTAAEPVPVAQAVPPPVQAAPPPIQAVPPVAETVPPAAETPTPAEQPIPPPAPVAAAPPPDTADGVLKEAEVYSGFKTLKALAYGDRIEHIHVKKGKTTVMPYADMAKVESKKDTTTFTMKDGSIEVFVFQTRDACAEWHEMILEHMG